MATTLNFSDTGPMGPPRTPMRPAGSPSRPMGASRQIGGSGNQEVSPRTINIYEKPSENFSKSSTLRNTNNHVRPEFNNTGDLNDEDFLATRKLYEDVPNTDSGVLYSSRVTPYTIPPRYGIREVASMKEKKLLNKNNKNYKGYIPHYKPPDCKLSKNMKKEVIIGYAGHIHGMKDGCGQRYQMATDIAECNSSIPRHRAHAMARTGGSAEQLPMKRYQRPSSAELRHTQVTDRNELELQERYERAISHVCENGFSQEYLLHLVQAKLVDTITTDSQLTIKCRNMFDKYNTHDDEGLDELEFWKCLESLNVQLLPDQNTALFAYFDQDFSGRVDWEEFSSVLLVAHPTGNTAIFPKITNGTTVI
mmetsp:Transcript_12767/g.16774  ORF Transcript_12767/g.16774 Transcript_12767/m.16774 type:complete len:364 (-) Transcript_12767:50-1141(-)